MNLWESLVLGLVQGLTEFLPVSSSGHLVLVGEFLDPERSGVGFEVWVHLATLVAVAVALRGEILTMARTLSPGAPPALRGRGRSLWIAVIVGTIPAVVFGFLAKDPIEAAFASTRLVAVDLLITAGFLLVSRFFPGRGAPLTPARAFLVGVAQAAAIFPGISRSGATLTAGLGLGLSGTEAARFSFLLAFPAILGAALLEAKCLIDLGSTQPGVLAVSFLAAMGSGYLAIRVVWRVMERGRLHYFAPYCALVGLAVLLWGRG